MELYISKDIQKEKIRFQKIIWAVKSNLVYQEPDIPGIHHTNQKWRDLPAQKMFSIKDFFSKCDQIRRALQIWSHLLKKSLMKSCIFFYGDYLHIHLIPYQMCLLKVH